MDEEWEKDLERDIKRCMNINKWRETQISKCGRFDIHYDDSTQSFGLLDKETGKSIFSEWKFVLRRESLNILRSEIMTAYVQNEKEDENARAAKE